MRNIVLVGMPGCGKSTVGVILAKTLGMKFVDTDLLICEKEENTLQNIIEQKGLEYFAQTECSIGKNLKTQNTVIATGGSMILYEGAMANLKEIATVIYIDVSLNELKERLVNIKTRGITFSKGETLEDIFTLRTPLYKHYADITVNADEFSIEETVTKLTELLK